MSGFGAQGHKAALARHALHSGTIMSMDRYRSVKADDKLVFLMSIWHVEYEGSSNHFYALFSLSYHRIYQAYLQHALL